MHLSFKKCIHFGTKLLLLAPQAQAWLCFSRDCLPDRPLCSLDGSWLLSNWKRLRHQHLVFLVSNRSSHGPVWISFLWYYFPGRDQETKTVSISNSGSSVLFNFSKFCHNLCGSFPGVTYLSSLIFITTTKRIQLSNFAFSPACSLSLLESPPISHITVGYRTVELHAPLLVFNSIFLTLTQALSSVALRSL